MGLEVVEFVQAVEEEFGIKIKETDAEHLITPRKVADYVAFCLGETPRDDILRRVIQIASEQFDVPLEQILPDHDFVKDLGVG
ncbi:MAG: phosphopantetheine-binding protein [Proteobacteria bacterium]|nr:phosphopantetheine-binding protein [Pseudomonadota bacterium]